MPADGEVPPQPGRPDGRSSASMARILVAGLALLLLLTLGTHLAPAIRAGLHDGVHGYWVATEKTCGKNKACIWTGKFVLPSGHVQIARTLYNGPLPATVHAGTRVAALDTGGSGPVFPASGSDVWISMLVGTVVALLALIWAGQPWLAGYLRRRREMDASLAPPLR
ncbi:MAG: hypothetical protein J2P29_13415 [Actinobacteria bacterium]|nr:hypothetical protein [Actinomycetota bacterium]